ncbi:MAG: hypothetical protein ABSF71_35780 [Terriglobia bacterium]
MKLLGVLLILCALSFGQTPLTKTQKQDCSKLTKAFKKHATDPGLTPEDVTAMLAAVHEACGTPEEQATATQDCESAIGAVDQDVKKNGPDPTSSRPDLNALLKTMRRACGLPEEPPATPSDTSPIANSANNKQTASSGEISKELDAAIETHNPQPTLDIHERVAQSSTSLNREIALGNRLIAHLQKAQTWEGVDADHPEAVALREKIAQEEKEFSATVSLNFDLNTKIDVHRMNKECTEEEVEQWANLMKEATGVMHDVKTQQDRYHALGY